MKASVFYIVKFWVSPEGEKRFLDWLDGGHIAKVIGEPGFLWARRCRLEKPDEAGWVGHINFYGIDSLDSLKRYFDSPARKRFLLESEQFKDLFKAERFHGTLDSDLAAPGRTGDEEPLVLYCGVFSVAPKSHQALFNWLDGKHFAEVISQPGFLWMRCVHLDECDENGWERYMMIYGQVDREALEDYFNSPVRERFLREREPFVKDLRMETFFGAVEFALDTNIV